MAKRMRPVFPSDLSILPSAIGVHQSFARWCIPGFMVTPDVLSRLVWLDVVSQAIVQDSTGQPSSLVQLYDMAQRLRVGWFSILDLLPPDPSGGRAGATADSVESLAVLARDAGVEQVFGLVRADRQHSLLSDLSSSPIFDSVESVGVLSGYLRVEWTAVDAVVLQVKLDLPGYRVP